MAAGLLLQSAGSKAASDDDDLISQLPDDLKHKILECLDTREAARTALLSTQWRDVWLRHGRLAFDWDFNNIKSGRKRIREDDKPEVFARMVTEILLFRSGPVKKFQLVIPKSGPKPLQSDLEAWCLYLSRNGVEELHLSFPTAVDQQGGKSSYKLPVCVLSCRTIKQLTLDGFTVIFPSNPRLGSTFSCLTSLDMRNCVVYKHNSSGTVLAIPNLEKLVFHPCGDIKDFVFSAPKLKNLCVMYSPIQMDWKWFEPHFRTVRFLMFSPERLLCTHAGVDVRSIPIAANLIALFLFKFDFAVDGALTTFIQLLKRFPNMLVLRIVSGDKSCSTTDARETAPRMLEDPSGSFDGRDLCKLALVSIETFNASRQEMLFMKALLSSSPALDKLVIKESANIDASVAFKFPRELLSFPRASPKARIIFDGR